MYTSLHHTIYQLLQLSKVSICIIRITGNRQTWSRVVMRRNPNLWSIPVKPHADRRKIWFLVAAFGTANSSDSRTRKPTELRLPDRRDVRLIWRKRRNWTGRKIIAIVIVVTVLISIICTCFLFRIANLLFSYSIGSQPQVWNKTQCQCQ